MLGFVMKNTTPTIKVAFSTSSSKTYKRLAFSIEAIKAKMAKGAKLVRVDGSMESFYTLDERVKGGATKSWFFRDKTQMPMLQELHANQ
jgi:hypothetical protein